MESTHCFYLIIIILSSISLIFSQSPYVPDHHFINCGSNSNTDFTGKTFIGDDNPSSFSRSDGLNAVNNNNLNTTQIYQTARVFTKKSWYEFKADDNNTFVMVRLHFAPFSLLSNFIGFELSSFRFDVSVLGFPLLISGFIVGNTSVVVIKEFIIPIGNERTFRIEFTPSVGSNYTFVNAIEAFTTPKELFRHGARLNHISPAGRNGDLDNIASSYAFNPIHRINVGGSSIEVEGDTLRRNWTPDDPFIFSNAPATIRSQLDLGLAYNENGAAPYDAPDDVYRTAKQLTPNSTVNITWNFGVKAYAMYLVRAHFCDIISTRFVNQNDAFNFFVYNHYKEEINPGNKVFNVQTPFYFDYVVDSVESEFVSVSIGAIQGISQPVFLNGLEIFELVKHSDSESKGDTTTVKLIIGFSCGFAGIVLMCLLFMRKKKLWDRMSRHMHGVGQHGPTRNHQIELFIQNYKSLAPKRFQYSEIKKMTKSFQEKLGQGGYGSVYKGELSDGHLVAVKLLNEAAGDGEDFINEVASIGRTSHINIVTLIGFCFQGKKRALVYEFMSNGSLDRFLRDDDSHLDWNTLFQIAKGIARGLEYLHRGCNTRIVHFDIKPHNVLLDEEFVPKISDFGLAKLNKKKESIVSVMGARGTAGYMAPEVFFKSLGGASHKSDVYSYGMMILEMTGARKNNNPTTTSASEAYFPEWIYKKVEAGKDLGVDGVTTEQEVELARKMVTVSLWCIQSDASDRPPISKVVEMLEGSFESLQVPPRRFWSSPTRPALGTSPIATSESIVGEALSS